MHSLEPSDPIDSATVGERTHGCAEYAKLERRLLFESIGRTLGGLRSGMPGVAGAAAGAGLAGLALPRVALAGGGGGPSRDVIVFVMLRGGLDGLTLCSPYADPDYAPARGNLAVPPPGSVDGSLDLDGFFGLSPAAAALMPAYQAGDLAFIHTSGSTDPTRSHFDAMRFIEGGVPNQQAASITEGWLGRHIAGVPPIDPAAGMRAAALGWTAPLTLAGGPKTLNISNFNEFDLEGWTGSKLARKDVLRDLYGTQPGPIGPSALAALDMMDVFGTIDFENYLPSSGADYPDTDFGNRFKNAAALIKADVGVEVLEIDRGDWDHHDQMGPHNGLLADMLGELSETLAAFYLDLGSLMNSVTVVALSEFGRRVDANGSDGTDHGRGGCMLALGANVNGGQVIRDWVGLDPLVLDDLALPVKIDYRDVLIEILEDRAANPNALSLFPSHSAPVHWNITSS